MNIEYPGLVQTVNFQQDFNYQLVLLAGKLIYTFHEYNVQGVTSEYLKEKWFVNKNCSILNLDIRCEETYILQSSSLFQITEVPVEKTVPTSLESPSVKVLFTLGRVLLY